MGEVSKVVESSSVLCENVPMKNKWKKAIALAELGLFVCVIVHRVVSLDEQGLVGLVALACESVFAVEVLLSVSTWWTPVDTKTNVERLLEVHAKKGLELPRVDMFVTTADAAAEPAMMTVNTVLSLMAVEYPEAHKLACYVSDDGHSPLLLHALSEASLFARIWVPFCKKYGVPLRAPFRYFVSDHRDRTTASSPEFRLQWSQMKAEYEALAQRIEDASKGDVFVASTEKGNHPAIIKVISENKGDPEGLPQLIYVCREKRPNHPHHYKAGAMNVLTRVSGLITNAPYMLNVDCDMYANNPTVVLQAMCAFIGLKPQDSAFVQFPQTFYDGPEDDPFANQMSTAFEMVCHGMAGIQGPPYGGTGCFHRRKRIYGFSIDKDHSEDKTRGLNLIRQSIGDCDELLNSVVNGNDAASPQPIIRNDDVLARVASCDYERGTAWGTHVGWGYQSLVEDLLTGMRIQAKGWSSVSLQPDPPGFMGMVPGSGPATLVQRKRWTTGLLQILLSSNSPFLAWLRGNLRFRQSVAYAWIMIWGVRAGFFTCYAVLPAYSIIASATFLPKVNQPAVLLFAGIFMTHHLQAICAYLAINQSIRTWWNNHRMTLIVSTTSDLYGGLGFVLERLGISDLSFDLTMKNQSDSADENAATDAGRFTFDESPVFVPATTVLLLNLTALGMAVFGRRSPEMGELFSSLWVVLCFWPFVRGLFGKGKYGIPSSTLFKSAAFTYVFVNSFAQPLVV